jgi:alpha-methylacyl-CoA racemase
MLRPLTGLKVIEFEGIGPGPLAGRMLADHGAEVIAVVRPNKVTLGNPDRVGAEDPLRRGKRIIELDLKQSGAVEEAMALVETSDALIEGNRPGVMERLGLGPADCMKRNPRLVYGRMTGWGQDGPLAQAAGHDLNYVALTGALSLSQRTGAAPIVPPTVLGDAGGALGLAFGIVAGVFATGRTGKGAVVDCAIIDVVAALSGIALWARARGLADGGRPSMFHDSPFYDAYPCADGRYVTIGALEPQFYALLIEKLGLADVDPKAQYDAAAWPALKARIRDVFLSKPSAHWRALLEGSDVCFAPALTFAEAAAHPHNVTRGVFKLEPDGRLDAKAVPRFFPARMNRGPMPTLAFPQTLEFPFGSPPKVGETIEVRPGIFWARLGLPFRLDHVNVYLIDDGPGLALIDTGIDNAGSRAAWEALLSGPLAGRRLTRIIATHFHPDHIGLAGWLSERFDLQLAMSHTEYLMALNIRLDPSALKSEPYRSFYRSHGLGEEETEILLGNGLQYLRMVAPPPRTFLRIMAEERVKIGGRTFEAMTGGGHSPEQVMLYSADDNLILCGDQVLARISPNVSVEAMDPNGDPLGIYIRSLERLKRTLPEDVLVLPGHNLPFVGLGTRADELIAHHEARCMAIVEACKVAPRTVAELVPVIFGRPIDDPHQLVFAFGEALAHVNLMIRNERVHMAASPRGLVLEAARSHRESRICRPSCNSETSP